MTKAINALQPLFHLPGEQGICPHCGIGMSPGFSPESDIGYEIWIAQECPGRLRSALNRLHQLEEDCKDQAEAAAEYDQIVYFLDGFKQLHNDAQPRPVAQRVRDVIQARDVAEARVQAAMSTIENYDQVASILMGCKPDTKKQLCTLSTLAITYVKSLEKAEEKIKELEEEIVGLQDRIDQDRYGASDK